MVNKINEIKNYLGTMYLEREDIIDGLLASLVARQHALMVGVPGTAKSAIVADLAKCFTGLNYFQWLLTRFSTPEELFGPVSLKALENDTYKRNTHGKLPEAHVAFVDEIFKANSAILNSLLTIANERLFYNNGGIVQSPISSLIGASNEWPEEGEGLEALFDRFILRYEIESISDGNNFVAMLKGDCNANRPSVSLQELEQLQMTSEMMTTIPDDVLIALRDIRDSLKQEGIRPSDRRFRQSLSLLKAIATLDDRDVVKRNDLAILSNTLWVRPEKNERDVVKQVVDDFSLDPVDKEIATITESTKDLMKQLKEADFDNTEVVIELSNKVKSLLNQLSKLPQDNKKVAKLTKQLEEKKQELTTAALGV